MAVKLTDLAVTNAKADAGKRQEIADAIVPGLFLIVQPSGAKSWAIRYRARGKPVKHTLGPHPRLSLKAARDLARQALAAVALGEDPAAEKRAAKRLELVHTNLFAPSAMPTAETTWWTVVEAFNERELSTKRSGPQVMTALRRETKARWDGRAIGSITRAEVAALVDDIKAGIGRKRGPAPVQAARVLAYVSWVFGWAMKRDIVDTNPCAKVERPVNEYDRRRTRVLDDAEIAVVWPAAHEQGYPFGAIIQFLILTGARLREVAEAEWHEFDLGRRMWTIPGARAKNGDARTIALTPPMLDLLQRLPRIGVEARFLFTTTGETPVSGFGRAKRQLDAALAAHDLARQARGLSPIMRGPFVFHDLRRSAASGFARLKVPFEVIERLLGHRGETASGLRAVYNRHTYENEMREALTRWSAHVMSLTTEGAGNVVSFERRA